VDGNWCSRFYGGRNGCVGDSYVTKGPEKYVGNSNGLECVQDPESDATNPWFCVRKGDSPPSAWACDKSQCLENGEPDDDCCAKPSEASCGEGFRYIQGDACWGGEYFNFCCRPEENTTTATSTTAPAKIVTEIFVKIVLAIVNQVKNVRISGPKRFSRNSGTVKTL